MKMSVKNLWKDTDREDAKHSEINLSHCHFVYHKSHVD